MTYQRQWAEYEQCLRNREVQIAQAQLRLDEVTHAIASLAVVRSPYAGRIRWIKWLGQMAYLLLEITFMVRGISSGDTGSHVYLHGKSLIAKVSLPPKS